MSRQAASNQCRGHPQRNVGALQRQQVAGEQLPTKSGNASDDCGHMAALEAASPLQRLHTGYQGSCRVKWLQLQRGMQTKDLSRALAVQVLLDCTRSLAKHHGPCLAWMCHMDLQAPTLNAAPNALQSSPRSSDNQQVCMACRHPSAVHGQCTRRAPWLPLAEHPTGSPRSPLATMMASEASTMSTMLGMLSKDSTLAMISIVCSQE